MSIEQPCFPEMPVLYDGGTGRHRIVSFWNMLHLNSRSILAALTYISGCIGEYKIFVQLPGHFGEPVARLDLEGKAQLLLAIGNLKSECKRIRFFTTAHLASEAYDSCSDILARQGPLTRHGMQTLLPILEGLARGFVAEARSHAFLVMDGGTERFLGSADDLFGADVVDAFPEAEFDLGEAGKCRAFGLWTASVMHLMRALEVGLKALAAHVGVVHEDNWNKTLNQIEARLREVRRKDDGPDAEQWAAEIGTQLRFIKNAWRNQAMHPLATYDEARAVAIYDNARLLLTRLADKIDRG